MKQYTYGFASAILLLTIVLLAMGLTPNPAVTRTGQYQVDTLLLTQEDYLGNKSYEVLYTIFDTSTGDIKQTRRVPHSNYLAKNIQKQNASLLTKIFKELKEPNLEDDTLVEQFKEKIKQMLSNRSKFEFNNDLMKKISKKEFSQTNFDKLSEINSSKIESIEIKSIRDNKKFSNESVKFIYSMSKNSFTLAVDENNNIYLVKIVNILENNISKNSKNFTRYTNLANLKIRNQMFTSYDFFLNDKYKVKINQKTLDRVKNYFR